MAKRLFKLSLGPDAREYDLHGTRAFPCEIYETSLQNMIHRQVPEHWHKETEIGFVEKGKINLTCNDETFHLHEGDIYFIGSGYRHSMKEASAKSLFYSIVFHEDMLAGPEAINEKYLYPVLHNDKEPALIFQSERIMHDLKEIVLAGDRQALGFEIIIRNYLSDIVLWIFEKYGSVQEPTKQPELSRRIEKMLTFISNNYMADIQVKEIADSAHISSRECYRTFRNELGRSPTVYLHEYRLKKASDILITTDRKIEDIARDCGYIHAGYFSTKFREIYQCSPVEYRKANKTGK